MRCNVSETRGAGWMIWWRLMSLLVRRTLPGEMSVQGCKGWDKNSENIGYLFSAKC